MTNEDDFINYLSKNGFDILTLSNMSLDAQINAMANARAVISPVGAGSAMAMFAPTDAVVIEIASRNLSWVQRNHLRSVIKPIFL